MNIENVTFGVEIETSIPLSLNLSVGHYHHGTPVPSAPQFNGASWKAESDCSIIAAPGCTPCEFVSPILKGEAGVLHLIEFVNWLGAIGAKVNSSCGLHVHIGVASFANDPAAVAKFVRILSRVTSRNATALYAQTGTPRREQGRFCAPMDATARREITRACRAKRAGAVQDSRYRLLNLTTVGSRGTVEFRCFAGTTNATKVLLHLFSVFALCNITAKRKSITNWDPNETLTGEQAMTRFLKARPMFSIVDVPVFHQHRQAMIEMAFKMARKYDEAKMGTSPNTPRARFEAAARAVGLNVTQPITAEVTA